MSHEDHADRGDAQLAKYAKERPREFARLLSESSQEQRHTLLQRVGRGLLWLARQREESER